MMLNEKRNRSSRNERHNGEKHGSDNVVADPDDAENVHVGDKPRRNSCDERREYVNRKVGENRFCGRHVSPLMVSAGRRARSRRASWMAPTLARRTTCRTRDSKSGTSARR